MQTSLENKNLKCWTIKIPADLMARIERLQAAGMLANNSDTGRNAVFLKIKTEWEAQWALQQAQQHELNAAGLVAIPGFKTVKVVVKQTW